MGGPPALSGAGAVGGGGPGGGGGQFLLADTAKNVGDYTTAVAAYKKYLTLNPESTQKAQIESLIKQLSPASSKPAKKKSKTSK